MKLPVLFIAFISASGVLSAAAPVEAQALMDKYVQAQKKLKDDYLKSLKDLRLSYLIKGKDVEALAVSAMIENEGGTKEVTDVEIIEMMKGTQWERKGNKKVITFRVDGTATKSWGVKTPAWTVKNGQILMENSTFKFVGKKFDEMEGEGEEKKGTWLKR